ncbi:MAG: SAM-dependent methyltransferase [Legionellales bacterium]|jgi:SAM-dependent MidA family methyltransferase|nr:SAM-dependent methyltransferase [Legionellales bacterium]
MNNPAKNHIKQLINNNGPIPFSEFMHAALYTPNIGYYSSSTPKIGAKGDFITAPEISPLFGNCIARQINEYIAEHGQISILELGPGNGTLAASILRNVNLDSITTYQLLEVSASLKQQQQQLLQHELQENYHKIKHIDKLPKNFNGIIIANEVADAMPVNRFTTGPDLLEQFVDIQNEKFIPINIKATNSDLISQVNNLDVNLPHGYSSETNLAMTSWIKALSEALQQGLVLLIDYGYPQLEYYHTERDGGTLTCFYKQKAHDNPFINIGAQDISAHVDFSLVAKAAVAANMTLIGYCEQSHFLMNLGLLELAQKQYETQPLLTAKEIKLLTMPNEMGSLCKVIGFGKNIPEQSLAGFCRYNKVESLFTP